MIIHIPELLLLSLVILFGKRKEVKYSCKSQMQFKASAVVPQTLSD
jgi:hypothetical protein